MRGRCILDVDGVLLDSIPAYRRAWAAWATEHHVHEDAIWAVAHGRRPLDIIRAVANWLDLTAALERFEVLIQAEYEGVEAVDGAHGLLERLPQAAWALATSGNRAVVEGAFRRLGLPLPAVGVYGEDVAAGKPDPACYLLAAQRLGALPRDCVVVEDSPSGVAAGKDAGMQVFAVTRTHTARDLREADGVFTSLDAIATTIGLEPRDDSDSRGLR